jgi:hypothetical protein
MIKLGVALSNFSKVPKNGTKNRHFIADRGLGPERNRNQARN